MSNVFSNSPPNPPAKYLKADWSMEEARFRDGLPEFLAAVREAKNFVQIRYEYKEKHKEEAKPAEKSEKNPSSEPVPAKGIVESAEKILPGKQETVAPPVVLANVPVPYSGSEDKGNKNAQKECQVTDIISDLFGDSPSPKKDEKPAVTDPFDAPVASKSGTYVDATNAVPVDPSTILQDVPPSKITPMPSAADQSVDKEKFGRVEQVVSEMLAGLPNFDLDATLSRMGEYSVCLDLDHLRGKPHILSDKLMEIQAKRDSLHSVILQLTPLYHSMKGAAEYFSTVGIDCFPGSSKEKRLAELKQATSGFWVRWMKVLRTNETAEATFKHLEGQYECISRLITCVQNKIGEISRGEKPWDPNRTMSGELRAPQVPQAEEPTPFDGGHAVPAATPPAAPPPVPENCEDFRVGNNTNAKSKLAPGEIDF